jgi:hypothetical protein
MSITYELWHGSRRGDTQPTFHPPKKGQIDLGPGIYATTWIESAQEDAKGGGAVRKIIISPKLLLQDAALSLSDALDFVTNVVVKSKQQVIVERMMERANQVRLENRVLLGTDTQYIFAEMLLNLCVNNDVFQGSRGQALAEFFTGQGIDADFQRVRGREEYCGIIFNPKIILSHEKVSAADVSFDQRELPSPIRQRELYLDNLKRLTRVIDAPVDTPSM